MLGLTRGGWKRSRSRDRRACKDSAWTAPDHTATAPASYSTRPGGLNDYGRRTIERVASRLSGTPASPLLEHLPDLGILVPQAPGRYSADLIALGEFQAR